MTELCVEKDSELVLYSGEITSLSIYCDSHRYAIGEGGDTHMPEMCHFYESFVISTEHNVILFYC